MAWRTLRGWKLFCPARSRITHALVRYREPLGLEGLCGHGALLKDVSLDVHATWEYATPFFAVLAGTGAPLELIVGGDLGPFQLWKQDRPFTLGGW